MNNLIKHFIESNRDLIYQKAIKNCHVVGLDSIVINVNPLIRIFIANDNHLLWTNHPHNYISHIKPSLGFHPHHCNLFFKILTGKIYNITLEPHDKNAISHNNHYIFDKFEYQSKINKGEISFKLIEERTEHEIDIRSYHSMQSFYMRADMIHTVYIPKDKEAIWAICEEDEDPNYKPYTYSIVDLTKEDFSKLYLKPFKEEVDIMILKVINAMEQNKNLIYI